MESCCLEGEEEFPVGCGEAANRVCVGRGEARGRERATNRVVKAVWVAARLVVSAPCEDRAEQDGGREAEIFHSFALVLNRKASGGGVVILRLSNLVEYISR